MMVMLMVVMEFWELEWDLTIWIDVAQDKGEWRALVDAVMNLQIT
jgi:hypothetical protein